MLNFRDNADQASHKNNLSTKISYRLASFNMASVSLAYAYVATMSAEEACIEDRESGVCKCE